MMMLNAFEPCIPRRQAGAGVRSRAALALAVLALAAACQRSLGDEPRALAQAMSVGEGSAAVPAPSTLESALPERTVVTPSRSTSARVAASEVTATAKVAPPWQPNADSYPWIADARAAYPTPVEQLLARFPPPPTYTREPRDPASFGAWLSGLPLAAPGTPVVTHRGEIRYAATDPRIAAVVAIDVGKADLQQCADTVIRLHAEWSWSQGRRDQSYRAASGLSLPYARFARGERLLAEGQKLLWQPGGRASTGHPGFRQYLNQVFSWANTVSLARQARPVPASEVRAGDFFVDPGNPGHTVIVLDLARDASGRRVALLGQSYMPAQSFYVLRGGSDGWFELEPGVPVDTPFWRPFAWETLRRLDE